MNRPIGHPDNEFLSTGLKITMFGTYKDIKHKIESFSRELETIQKN